MSKITYETLNSANVKINNSSDAERIYNIEANANVNNLNEVTNIDNGILMKDTEQKATFNVWGSNSLNISFYNTTSDEQCGIVQAINQFIEDTKNFIKNNGMYTLSAE